MISRGKVVREAKRIYRSWQKDPDKRRRSWGSALSMAWHQEKLNAKHKR